MGIFQISAGDYRRFRSAIVEIGSSETEHKLGKERIGRHLSQFSGYNLQLPDWLAGDAVLIAPVSKQIPWYQGILQGILRFWGSETRFSTKKPLRCSHFSSNSLRKLTGYSDM